MSIDLQTPVGEINQLTQKLAPKLKKLEIETISDLIFYYPSRYVDFSLIVDIKDLSAGAVATIRGRVELIKNQRSWKKRMLVTEAIISDLTGSVKVIWFGQYYVAKILQPGDEVFIAGKVDYDKTMIFYSPSYEKITAPKNKFGTTHTARIVPVYNLTKGVTSKQLRYLIKIILPQIKHLPDYLPVLIKSKLGFPELLEAVRQIHFPDSQAKLRLAQNRLKFDEIFLIQLKNQLWRAELKKTKASNIVFQEQSVKQFVSSLPFKLTNAQRKAAWEILQDLARGYPMNRLLEGDVGSGKTVVAALAMLNTVKNGCQAALMAPTEILARQHFNTLSRLLDKTGVKIGLVTRSEKRINQEIKKSINPASPSARQGGQKINSQDIIDKADIVIGTQALIQEKVKFKNLALAVVDEQHRFGVEQRRRLLEQAPKGPLRGGGVMPHFLSLTATPIPRSLALTLYGDLDLSILDELPAGRKIIATKIVKPEERVKAYDFIRKEIVSGRQVFVICPLIDPSDKLGVKSVKEEFEKLDKEVFPEIPAGFLHGRLPAAAKEKVMQDFLANKIKILVSTSVVEVGVDAPNASVMMIEGAERFGLAQLHQFRGRVGRSEHQSYCFLLTESSSVVTAERLQALVESHDGFKLAEKDLQFRGPGEVFGRAQSGVPDLKLANLFDFAIIKQAREWAARIIKADPALRNYPQLLSKIGQIEQAHLE